MHRKYQQPHLNVACTSLEKLGSVLPGREARALSAVCRSVSPSCHWLWGSSHSFSPATCCSARRSSESARQRSSEVRSLSTSAEQETDCQPLHNHPVFWLLSSKIYALFGNVMGDKMQIGSTGVKRLSECQKNIRILLWTEGKHFFSWRFPWTHIHDASGTSFSILFHFINDWRKEKGWILTLNSWGAFVIFTRIFNQCTFYFAFSNSSSIFHTDLGPSVRARSSSASVPRSLPGPEPTQSPGLHNVPLHLSHSCQPAYDAFSLRLLGFAARVLTVCFSPAPSEIMLEQVSVSNPRFTLHNYTYCLHTKNGYWISSYCHCGTIWMHLL